MEDVSIDEIMTEEAAQAVTRDGFFQENGAFSMRRLLAFIFALASIGGGVFSLAVSAAWQIVLCAFGAPMCGSILMMFFTPWQDVAQIAQSARGR